MILTSLVVRGHPLLLRRSLQRKALFHSSQLLYAKVKVVRPFLLADIGEGITECEVIKWSVKPSSTVGVFDPLCEVQSDKATVDITSPFDGVVKELLVKEGEIAKVGSGLCLIEVEEEQSEAHAAPAGGQPTIPAPTPQETAAAAPPPAQTPPPPPTKQRKPHPLDPSAPQTTPTSSSTPVLGTGSDAHVLATPSVRHFARQQGISDLSLLHPGSGRNGRVERADVDAYLVRKSAPAAAPTTPQASVGAAPRGENVTVEFGRTRWAMWKSMTKSLEIPHFGYSTTLDLTALHRLLPTLNAHIPLQYNPPPATNFAPAVSQNAIYTSSNTPIPAAPVADPSEHYTHMTMLPLLLKSLSRAMEEWPLFRSSLTPNCAEGEKPTLTIRPHADIAIGLSTPTGLYTPTITQVDSLSPYEIMARLRRFSTLGRRVPSGLTMTDMPRSGGTITVSNVGAIGKGESAMPLLVPGGGVAIVAIGRAKWVRKDYDDKGNKIVNEEEAKRLEVGVSWSADHRIVEGAELAAFVECWRGWVEDAGRLVGAGR